MFGPRITIMGDHCTNVLGAYMCGVKEKLPESSRDVVVEDDGWIGAGAIFLKGVTIGRDPVVGAGSVATRSIRSYSIAVGNGGQVKWCRLTPEQIEMQESLLGRAE